MKHAPCLPDSSADTEGNAETREEQRGPLTFLRVRHLFHCLLSLHNLILSCGTATFDFARRRHCATRRQNEALKLCFAARRHGPCGAAAAASLPREARAGLHGLTRLTLSDPHLKRIDLKLQKGARGVQHLTRCLRLTHAARAAAKQPKVPFQAPLVARPRAACVDGRCASRISSKFRPCA